MKRVLISFAFAVSILGGVVAQTEQELDKLDNRFRHQLQSRLRDWTYERGEPMQGSKNVLIQFWSSSNRRVKITIIPNKSAAEAREKMEIAARDMWNAKELPGVADKGYSWGYADSNVFFRRGKFTIYVSTYADVGSDADACNLSGGEKGARTASEMRRLSREFAEHMVTAIDTP